MTYATEKEYTVFRGDQWPGVTLVLQSAERDHSTTTAKAHLRERPDTKLLYDFPLIPVYDSGRMQISLALPGSVTAGLAIGSHVIDVVYEDAANGWGPFTLVFVRLKVERRVTR